jgi:hypothetical protein
MGNCREAYKDKRSDGMPLGSTILIIVKAKHEKCIEEACRLEKR